MKDPIELVGGPWDGEVVDWPGGYALKFPYYPESPRYSWSACLKTLRPICSVHVYELEYVDPDRSSSGRAIYIESREGP